MVSNTRDAATFKNALDTLNELFEFAKREITKEEIAEEEIAKEEISKEEIVKEKVAKKEMCAFVSYSTTQSNTYIDFFFHFYLTDLKRI